MIYQFIHLHGCKFREGKRERFLPQQHLLLSLHIISSVGSSPALSSGWLNPFGLFLGLFLTSPSWDVKFLSYIYRQLSRSECVSAELLALLGVGSNSLGQMRSDSKATQFAQSIATTSHHFHMTTTIEGERGPRRWRSKGWARENKSGDKFGATVTAEGKKKKKPRGRQNKIGILFLLSAGRQRRQKEGDSGLLLKNIICIKMCPCITGCILMQFFYSVGKINVTFYIYINVYIHIFRF